MSINGPREITSEASRGRPEGGFLGLLRTVSLIAVVAGGSLALMLRAGQRTPRLLLVFFIIWVLSPYVALLWANMVSKRWSILSRATLYCVTLVVTLGSLAIYSEPVDLRPLGRRTLSCSLPFPGVMGVHDRKCCDGRVNLRQAATWGRWDLTRRWEVDC